MNHRSQTSVARRWLPPLAVAVLLAAGVAYVASAVQAKVYEAQATLIVGTSLSGSPDYNELLVSEQLAETYATVATTRPILTRVKATVGLEESVGSLRGRISAVAQPDSTLLTITARDGDPARAALLVNALVEQLIASSPSGEEPLTDVPQSVDEQLNAIRAELEADQARLEELAGVEEPTQAQLDELQAIDANLQVLRETYATLIPFSTTNAPNLLTVVDPAVAPENEESPRPAISALVAAMAAILIGGSIAFVVEYPTRPRSAA